MEAGAVDPAAYSVKVCNDSGGEPGSACDTLTSPASLAGGGNVFTASGAGIDLTKDTTYWVVFDSVNGGSGTVEMRRTAADGEDSVGAAGWGIADDGHSRARTSTATWDTGSNPHKMGVFGYAKTNTPTTLGPAAPTGLTATPYNGWVSLAWTDPSDSTITRYQYRVSADGGTSWVPDWTDVPSSSATTTSHVVSGLTNGTGYAFEVRAVARAIYSASASATATPAGALVQNLNKYAVSIGSGTNTIVNDSAQAFTTGSNTAGYKLTSVVLGFALGAGATQPTGYGVKVCDDSGSAPGSACDTLTSPAALAAGGNIFPASGAGIDLTKDTTYWIVFDSETGGSGTVEARRTADDGEDSVGAGRIGRLPTTGIAEPEPARHRGTPAATLTR